MGNSSSHQRICEVCSKAELDRLLHRGDPSVYLTPSQPLFVELEADRLVETLKHTVLVLDDSYLIRSRRQTCQLCAVVAEALDRLSEPNSGSCFARGRVAFGWRLTRGYNLGPANITSRIQIVHSPLSAMEVRRTLLQQPQPQPRLYDPYDEESGHFTYDELTSLLELQVGAEHLPTTATNFLSDKAREARFSARLVNPSGIDFQLVHKWAKYCRENHELCSYEKGSPSPSTEDFFLIDTQNLCICAAPRDTPYIALSYCWGTGSNAPALRHTLENSTSLRSPGALSSDRVPKTIKDAIFFAKNIDVRYLWVDVLCIVQDDPVRKKRQIAEMDAIYYNADLAIIAASGAHSNMGIPGVQPGTRHQTGIGQKIIRIGRLKMVTVIDWTGEGDMATTPWVKRAWTLQEHLLSRRKVFVTDKQMYWQCREACYAEEVVLEDVPNVEFTRHLIGPAFSFNLTRRPWAPKFETIVRDYISRKLSYRSDTLDAFAGVMSALQRSETPNFQKGFFGCLLACKFNAELSWEMECTGRDNATLTTMDNGCVSTEVPYPTWSWTAWFGSDIIKPIWWEETGYAQPLIQFYVVDLQDRLLPILDGDESIHVPGAPDIGQTYDVNDAFTPDEKNPLRNLWYHYPRTEVSCLETGEDFGIDSGKLKFWTSVGSLPIYRKTTTDGKHTYHYGTFEGEGKLQWHIRPVKLTCPSTLDWQLPKTSIHAPERPFSWPRWGRKEVPDLPFQGVFPGGPEPRGRIDPVRHVSFPLSTDDLQPGHNENGLDFSIDDHVDHIVADFVIIGRSSTTIQAMLRALVVEWRDGIAYRIGCAWIDERDWAGLNPKMWKLVTMG